MLASYYEVVSILDIKAIDHRIVNRHLFLMKCLLWMAKQSDLAYFESIVFYTFYLHTVQT